MPHSRTAADARRAMLALPFAPVEAVTDGKPFLVLAPHPDDESLGAGGLIAAAPALAHVLIVTDGAGSHPNSRTHPAPVLIALRQAEARAACAALGVAEPTFLDLPDTAAPANGPAVDDIATHAQAIGAATLLSTWEHDPHCDHLATHRLATAVAARLGLRHWAYPVWGWNLPAEHALPPLPPGVRIDIAAQLDTKRRAIACHRSQMTDLITDDPHGFALDPAFLRLFDRPFEVFLRLR